MDEKKKAIILIGCVLILGSLIGYLAWQQFCKPTPPKPVAAETAKTMADDSNNVCGLYKFPQPFVFKGKMVATKESQGDSSVSQHVTQVPSIKDYPPIPSAHINKFLVDKPMDSPGDAPDSGNGCAIQGILIGTDVSSAILGDGRIVREGDIVGNDRVTAILRNGIVFDSGKRVFYGIRM